MKRLAALGVLLLIPGCLTVGCSIPLDNAGEIGFRQSTSWGFYHRAEATEGHSRSAIESQLFDEWIRMKIELAKLKAQQDEAADTTEEMEVVDP